MKKQNMILTAAVGIGCAAAGIGAGALIWGGPPAAEGNEAEAHEEGPEGEAQDGFVALAPQEARAAGVEIATVARGGGSDLIVPGRVAFAPDGEAQVGAPLAGVVEAVHVAPGAQIRAGAALVTIRSVEGAALRASADAARAEAEASGAAFRRETRLFNERVTARQDLEAARAASLRAGANVRSAQAQLAAVGSPAGNGRLVIRAPIAGTVINVAVGPGGYLNQGAAVASVANQQRLELIFDAPAAVSRAIGVGTPIQATIAGGQEVQAIVTAISPNAGDAGAQVRARAIGFVPPPGTPVSGRLLTDAAAGLVVPSDAIQTVAGRQTVFVAERRGFRARAVVTGRVAGGRTEIIRGLTEGERVAGRGAFLLKAELSRDEAEHDH